MCYMYGAPPGRRSAHDRRGAEGPGARRQTAETAGPTHARVSSTAERRRRTAREMSVAGAAVRASKVQGREVEAIKIEF
jgi:hypothetical protein